MKRLICIFLICISCQSQTSDKKQDLNEIQTIENGLLLGIQVEGDPVKTFNIVDRMNFYKVPGVSIAVVEDGKLKWAKGYGIANSNTGAKVDENTMFQAGSISKPIAALAVLQLVEKGILDLDEDVNNYLKDWKIPDNEFTKNEKVTLRRLLTHTAGVTVHGFPGYKQSATFPTTTQVLNGEGNTSKIFVDTVPGSIWRYSGGGYTIAQKVIEDVTQQSLETYMASNVLEIMNMENSTFEQPLANREANASAAYDFQGKIIDGLWHNYPEKAAAGLWTTPSDLAKYCIEIQEILKGKENAVLQKETVVKMLTKHKNDWGLGPSLHSGEDFLIFRHGGKNAGFTNRFLSFTKRGYAVVIMTNADNGNSLIDEISRAISKHYDLGISDTRTVKTVELSNEELSKFTGKYKLNYQVPNIGDYFIEISIKNNKLFVNDPNNGDTKVLTALGDLKFIDLTIGDQGTFQIENDKIGLVWGNNRFQFYKVDE
ncbi:serine hydrolase [uncultured Kordia sp.]|uniref:serine hydrolase domain-containing protein n=1 Tax=uncultured Kordia sp. TaxID=507699 RepID=UPI00263322EB|nr:serine hydrolase domain-containing protein [uncultured Kordia sp.]